MSSTRPDHLTWRHWVVTILVLAALGLIVFRLYRLQIVDHQLYLERAIQTRHGDAEVPAPRGVITDATGYPLAASIDTWDVYIDRFLWRDREQAGRGAPTGSGALCVGSGRRRDARLPRRGVGRTGPR